MFLNSLNQSAIRLRSQIKAVQDHSRLGGELNFSEVCLLSLIDNVKPDLGGVMNNKWVRFTIGKMPQKIQCMPYELKMLIRNLIHNAIKYNDSDIRLVNLRCKSRDHHFEFSIEDNGIGIEEKYQDQIFNIFRKIDSRDGIGIGLSNCRKIANSHLGEMWVRSKKGSGSKFFFTIKKNLKSCMIETE